MDATEEQRIAQAFLDTNYSWPDAASRLGIPIEDLRSKVNSSNRLKVACNKTLKPRRKQSDRKDEFKDKLTRAGIVDGDLSMHLERTALFQAHGSQLLSLVTGNANVAFLQAMGMIPDLLDRIRSDDYTEDEFGVARRGQDHDLLGTLLKLGITNSANLQQAHITAAKVKKMLGDMNNGGGPKHAKAGFKPLESVVDVEASE